MNNKLISKIIPNLIVTIWYSRKKYLGILVELLK